MKTYIVAILLVLSLAGRLSAAVAEDTIIRLPSHGPGVAGAGEATAVTDMGRPSCCDREECGGTILRTCRCVDAFDHKCPATCVECVPSFGPSRYYCFDRYLAGPVPKCTKVDCNGDISGGN
ncbi:hypothetical protein VPH35_049292 [Triticum aestivum]